MLRRFIRWLLGIPPPEQLEAERRLAAERERGRAGVMAASDRAGITGLRRWHGPREW